MGYISSLAILLAGIGALVTVAVAAAYHIRHRHDGCDDHGEPELPLEGGRNASKAA